MLMSDSRPIRASVAGASGYGGGELIRLLHAHPTVEVVRLAAGEWSGRRADEAWPSLRGVVRTELEDAGPAELAEGADVVFLALPHGMAMDVAPAVLEAGARVVDLSGDFRLRDAGAYPRWYGRVHPAPELLAEAVYGLPELDDGSLPDASLVACPGCYPTAVGLALAPLVADGAAGDTCFVDAKSGVSGAGRSPGERGAFAEANESVRAYGVPGHRHTPEMEQTASSEAGRDVGVSFVPHVVPMTRGILATCQVPLEGPLDAERALGLVEERYGGCPFVRVDERLPETKATTGSNFCDLSVRVPEEGPDVAVVVAALDNLVKGAAGQAVQCMNLMFDLDEREGLWNLPIYP